MNQYRRRRARVCAAMHELTRRAPLAADEHGPPTRRFESGALTLVSQARDGWVHLDAWLYGEGRVASFRTVPEVNHIQTVSWKPGALMRWEGILDFELAARTELAR
jgi:hypothetical protein